MAINGKAPSTLIDTTPQACQLSVRPDLPPLVVQVWPDYRGAPNDAAALTSTLVLLLVQQSHVLQIVTNRLAALEIHAAEQSRGAEPQIGDRARDDQRAALAIQAIRAAADGIEISAQSPASALDGITLQ